MMPLVSENEELAEEIEAVNAIYDPGTVTVTRTTPANATTNTLDLGSPAHSNNNIYTTVVTLQIPEQPHLSFILGFEASYPDSRPAVLGTASTAARGEGKIAIDVLEEIVQRTWQAGAVCLFDVISEAVDIFPELSIGQDDVGDSSTQTPTVDASSTATEAFGALSLRDAFGLDAPPEWILSDVVSEKKSVFVGRVARVTSLAQAQAFLDHLTATDRKVAAASHNISAWRIRHRKDGDGEGGETVVQDYDDDGETAAGARLLHVMQLMDVWNVVVVVSRWYGGIQLGPARFRLINDAGRDALVKGGFTKEREEAAAAEKGKKKGKK
ncbi:Ubiquitin-conjugating enzyme/RWD-like [Penicillium roqueforti FM164]|uniref:Ubiquitin-conjugating enzyme/RWD-like n=2 Tax=Penicillium roqueforti TaxID=5082 RepID=W6Q0U3_PENRF|nr:Ubiquitin-conjugating enzyme/RWD-like [Penicillium roqueforti FM164]